MSEFDELFDGFEDAPASEGAGGTGGLAPLPALSETGDSVPSTASEEQVGDLAVTGTGLSPESPESVQTSSGAASRAGRTLGRLGAKKGYAAGVGLQRAAKRKKRERETIRVPAVKQTDCPRWMHHRPGVYCKTCGKTP